MTASQQMLVDTLQMGDATYEKAIKGMHGKPDPKDNISGLNDQLDHIRKGDTPWDGAIWPYGASSPRSFVTCVKEYLLTKIYRSSHRNRMGFGAHRHQQR